MILFIGSIAGFLDGLPGTFIVTGLTGSGFDVGGGVGCLGNGVIL